MAKTLQIQFEAANGKSLLVSVDDPKETLTQAQVEAGAQVILTSDVFNVEGTALTVIKSAKIVERNVEEII